MAARMYLAQTAGKKFEAQERPGDDVVVVEYGTGSTGRGGARDVGVRGISEALFSNSSTASKYSSKEDIESNLRNKEIGSRVKKIHTRAVVDEDADDDDDDNDDNKTHASHGRHSRSHRERSEQLKKPDVHQGHHRGKAHTQEENAARVADSYRLLREDPAYLRLSEEFSRTHSAGVALDLAKYLVGRDDVLAENYFKEALACDPTNARVMSVYAIFVESVSKDYDRAERLYQGAALSGQPVHLRAYATFLRAVRGDDELADRIDAAANTAANESNTGEKRRHHRSK